MIAPFRSPPWFGAAMKAITALPVPLVGAANEIQAASVVAVHTQSTSFAVRVTVDSPPLVAIICVAGDNVKRHGARCDTRACSLLTTIVASRTDAPSLAAARNETVPLPCPDVGDNPVIQLAVVEAVHAHSGSVVTVIELLAPAASRIPGAATETWHLTGSGPVETVDVVSHAAATIAATNDTTAATATRDFARTRWARMRWAKGVTLPTAEWLLSKRHSTVDCCRLSRTVAPRFD